MVKQCGRCKIAKPAMDFYKNTRARSGLQSWCKACMAATSKAYSSQRHLLPARRERHRRISLRRKFGMTIADYDAMHVAQNGVCAICRKPETKVIKGTLYRLAVDHDAVTGAIRGLLCDHCNTGIGKLRHDVKALRRAIAYLKRPTKAKVVK